MRHTIAVAVVLSLVGILAACGGDDEPKADPTPTRSPTTAESSSTPPASEPTWDKEYTPAQLKRYRAARDHWLEYWEFYTEAARKGVDTPGVVRGFEKYSMAPLSEHSEFLETYVEGGARMEVAPKVLWTSASKIERTVVIFNYCLDYTNARITTNGRLTDVSDPARRLIKVQMRHTTKGWMKERYVDQGVTPCGKTAP